MHSGAPSLTSLSAVCKNGQRERKISKCVSGVSGCAVIAMVQHAAARQKLDVLALAAEMLAVSAPHAQCDAIPATVMSTCNSAAVAVW